MNSLVTYSFYKSQVSAVVWGKGNNISCVTIGSKSRKQKAKKGRKSRHEWDVVRIKEMVAVCTKVKESRSRAKEARPRVGRGRYIVVKLYHCFVKEPPCAGLIQCYCCCSSHKRVVKEVQDRMVADHLATLHAETGTMVCSERIRDLSNMYTLLRPVPNGLSQLVHHLKEHIKQQGLQAITSLKGDNVSAALLMQTFSTTTYAVLGAESALCPALNAAFICFKCSCKNFVEFTTSALPGLK